MKPVIIDFEASALMPPCFPVQVAVINGKGQTYETLIQPCENWLNNFNWNPESAKIHGFTKRQLIEEGKTPYRVATELNEFIGKDGVVYCDGGVYDIMWADELYKAANVERQFRISTVWHLFRDANVVYNFEYRDCVQYAHEKMHLRQHDALNDVIAIQEAVTMILDNRIPRELEDRWKITF